MARGNGAGAGSDKANEDVVETVDTVGDETATDETLGKKTDASDETKYEMSQLRTHCLSLFGVTTSTFDGATQGLTGSQTIAQIKKALLEWGGKELKKWQEEDLTDE